MDPLRLVDVRGQDGDGQGCGSGYLVAPRLVLTARHVVERRASALPWPRIDVYVGHPARCPVEHRRAEVRWVHGGGRDVALLELDAAVDLPGEVLWGWVGGNHPVPYLGLAFPLATRTADGHRKVEQLEGSLPPLTGGRGAHDLYALNQVIAPGEREDGRQAWAGASGAAVFCGDRLVGVVVHDDHAFRNHRLHACPAQAFGADPGFQDLLREHGTAPPDLVVVEAGPAPVPGAVPQTALPSWLSALPVGSSRRFVGRGKELRNARSLASQGGRVLSVVGPEHTGKSAFIERLVGDEDFHRALGADRPWGLLDLDVPGCGSRFPVSRALATQLDADLFTVEEYGEDTISTERKIKHMLGTLSGAARGHDIVAVIDCARFGERVADLEADLDEVLGNSALRRAVVLIASATRLQANGGRQLRQMGPVRLGPLSPEEAVELLSAELDERDVRVDVGQVIDLAGESLVRRPGILLFGADQHANRYDIDEGPHDADPVAVALDLLDACRVTITEVLEEAACGLFDGSGSPGPLAPLVVWAMTERLPVPQDVLTDSGIRSATFRRLVTHGVLVERQPSEETPRYELSRATWAALRNMTLAALDVDEAEPLRSEESALFGPAAQDPELLDETLHRSAKTFFDAVLPHFEDEEGDDKHRALLFAVECALGWLRARADGRLPRLDLWVKDFANALDTKSIVQPGEPSTSPVEEAALDVLGVDGGQPSDGNEMLYRAVSRLNAAMREPVTARAESRFVEACRQAVDILCHRVPGIPPQMLRSIENALYLGGRRYGCDDDMLRVRTGVAEVLSEGARRIEKGRVSRLVWTVSWLLNTADLQVDKHQLAEARTSTGLAHDLLELLPLPNTTGGEATQLNLRMRANRARARTADNEPERLEAWAEAVRLGGVALERCAPTTALRHLWTQRLLDAAKYQAFELRSDDERSALVELVTGVLTGSYGPLPAWGLSVRLTVARFLRSVHRRQADPILRLDGANDAMALLLPYEEILVQQAEAGDAVGLLELARTADFKAWSLEQNERFREAAAEAGTAKRHAVRAVRGAPSARAHRVWLECVSHYGRIQAGGPEGPAATQELRRAVRRTREWLDTQEARTQLHAQLARLCIVEEWHLRGRSLRQAAAAKEQNSDARLDPLQQVYRERARALEGHETRYGPTVGTALLRCDLEREYQRLRAAHQHSSGRAGQSVDYGPAWRVLDRAEEQCPPSTSIGLARARLHRYLWEYTEAAEALESVIRVTRSGQERRQAQIEMAEALLRHVRYGSPDPSEREAALERAAAQLEEPLTHRFQSEQVIVLRERIRLEAGAPVDQRRIDAAFDKLIGTDYTRSIGRYLHNRRYSPTEPGEDTESEPGEGTEAEPGAGTGTGPGDEPQNLAQLLYDDFTDVGLIDGLGQLYLRQAETRGAESDPDARHEGAEAARRAYDCFDACRVLLEAQFDMEHPVNRFKRAEAIRQAARLARTADPFAWKPEGKSSWLKLAVDLFQSAAGRSVDVFHTLCVGRVRETQQMLNRLGG
ncbi:trypsin-like serine protease [Streptomyces sp. NPDC058751]|uniref:trypsin-like serine protease n=1 Tax=Streptomyces sp. NPDC058751 TaxID=3346623 RepID=UPI00367C2F20